MSDQQGPQTQWPSEESPEEQPQQTKDNHPPAPDSVPPQQQSQQVPAQPAKKNRFSKKAWPVALGLLILILGIVFISLAANASKGSKPASTKITQKSSTPSTHKRATALPTATPTQAPTQGTTWKTVQTYSGSGTAKTDVFQVGSDWKIVWSCDPSSYGGPYKFFISVNTSDNTILDLAAVNTTCQSGNATNTVEEQQGGSVYLNISTDGPWKIEIQELK